MKFKSPLLGSCRGKIGGSVAARVLDINYLKEKVDPSQPRTAPQVFQRDKFTFVQVFASSILLSIIQKYWKIYRKKMYAWNKFVSENLFRQTEYVDPGTPFAGDFSKFLI